MLIPAVIKFVFCNFSVFFHQSYQRGERTLNPEKLFVAGMFQSEGCPLPVFLELVLMLNF